MGKHAPATTYYTCFRSILSSPPIPTVHPVPRQAVGPLLPADNLVLVHVAAPRKVLGAPLRLHELLHDLPQVPVLDLVQGGVVVPVEPLELPLDDDPVHVQAAEPRGPVLAVVLRVKGRNEASVELGLVGPLAVFLLFLRPGGRSSSRGLPLAPAAHLRFSRPPDGRVRNWGTWQKLPFLKISTTFRHHEACFVVEQEPWLAGGMGFIPMGQRGGTGTYLGA